MRLKKETLLKGGFSDVLVDYGYKLLVYNFIGLHFGILEHILSFLKKDPFSNFLLKESFEQSPKLNHYYYLPQVKHSKKLFSTPKVSVFTSTNLYRKTVPKPP